MSGQQSHALEDKMHAEEIPPWLNHFHVSNQHIHNTLVLDFLDCSYIKKHLCIHKTLL